MIIQFSASIEEIKRNKDKTLRLKVDTQELDPDESSKIFELQDAQIWIALAEVPLKAEQITIPESVDEFDRKTPSQRLRDRQFVYFKEKKIAGDFETWRRGQLEKIGQSYLEKLQ